MPLGSTYVVPLEDGHWGPDDVGEAEGDEEVEDMDMMVDACELDIVEEEVVEPPREGLLDAVPDVMAAEVDVAEEEALMDVDTPVVDPGVDGGVNEGVDGLLTRMPANPPVLPGVNDSGACLK